MRGVHSRCFSVNNLLDVKVNSRLVSGRERGGDIRHSIAIGSYCRGSTLGVTDKDYYK